MFILGYSGLNDAIEFRKKLFEKFSEREYRICQGMDSAAALLYNGEIVAAAAEERFNDEVHTCKFPINAIRYCLEQANISINDLSQICHGFDYTLVKDLYQMDSLLKESYASVYDPNLQTKLFQERLTVKDIGSKFVPVRHHDAHAASTFYPSGFGEALIIVADGLGEIDSISIYSATDEGMLSLQRQDLYSSLGMFYSMITYHLGFEPNNDEYKVMGLASYGDPYRFKLFFERCIELHPRGKIYIPAFNKNKTFVEKQTYRGFREWLNIVLSPEREKREEVKQIHKDIAAGLQQRLTQAMSHVINYWQEKTELKNLCMAGGVALNCTTNGVLLKTGLFNNIYIQPAAGDDGTAIGAALYQFHCLENVMNKKQTNLLPFYGPEFDNDSIKQELEKYCDQITLKFLDETELLETAAMMMADGAIIAWMQGRMEFGPRALGNRSILADPRRADMKNKINKVVKKREEFRPFAPSVKLDKAHLFFDVNPMQEFPYMLFTVQVKEQHRDFLPAITHIDGSARLQTVNKIDHPLYWKLLDHFENKTKYPILLNTSFNVKGQPIVNTPNDAIMTLLSTEIDALFIGNYLVRKLNVSDIVC